jgi:hypothetical protein
MLVAGLDHLPPRDALLERLVALRTEELSIDGVPIKWDFGSSNHFITIYRAVPLDGRSLSPYGFVMHGAGSEFRGETRWGDGLYWNQSEALRRKAEVLETPFGPLRLLTGRAAREYYDSFQQAEAFARARRSLVAGRLFDGMVPYNNDAHQGLVSMNDMVLGTYLVPGTEEVLFPLTLQAGLPAYLVKGLPNLSDAVIEGLGLGERARKLGLYERLRSANILPHGGGYAYPHLHDILSVIELEHERLFELGFGAGNGRQIIANVRDLPYAYRGLEVVNRVTEMDLGELVVRLDPVYGLKL